MARRKKKLNKPVVILLSGIGLVVIVLAVTALWGMGFIDRIFPKDPARLAREAEQLLQQGKYREAIRRLDEAARAAAVGEDKAQYLLRAGRARMEYFYNDPSLGQAQRRSLFFKAHALFKDAIRLKPDMLEAHRELAELERILAGNRGAWESYIQCLDEILRLAPDDHETMFARAVAKARAAEANPDYFEPAVADFKAAIELAGKAKVDPKDAEAVKALARAKEKYWVALALFYSRHERKAEAERTFREGIRANPDSAALRITFAEFLQMLERYPEALSLLREAIRVKPNKAAGHLAISAYYRRQAWRLRRQAVQEKDKARREALLKQVEAQQEKVIAALTKATEVEPGNCEGFLQLASIRRLQGKLAEAEAILLRGLQAQEQLVGEGVSAGDDVRKRNRCRAALLALNHQLCDVLFDRIRAGGKKEDFLPRIQAALERMRSIRPDSPYVAKIEGRLALLAGERVKAEQLLRKAYEGFGSHFDFVTAQLLINLYSQLNQLGEAENILNRYLRRYPDNPRALLALARLNMEYREYGKALRIVESALKKSPEDEQVQRLKLLLEVLTGKSERLAEDIKSLDAREAFALLLRAQQLWGSGRHAAAIRLAADIVNRRAGFVPAMSQLIRWYQQAGQRDQALAVYKVAQKIYKGRQDVLARLAADLAASPQEKLKLQLQAAERETDPLKRALHKAAVYRQHGMTKEFLQQLKAAEAIKPDHPLVVELLFSHALSRSDWATAQKCVERAVRANLDKVGGRMYKARLARARKKYEEAIRLTLEALRLRPRFSQAHAFLGTCYLAVNRLDRAREEFQTAHEQNPSNVRALLGLVAVSEAEGRPADYARWVELAYKFRPDDPVVRERYLRLRESREKPEDVIKKREQWLRTDPQNITNLARLGPLYERVGRWDDAERVYRTLVRLTKGSLPAVRMLTELLRRTDRDAEARTILAENVRKSKDKVGAYLLWADYMERAEEYAQARSLYAKAVEADPKDPRGYIAAARFEARRQNWAKAAEFQRRCLQNASGVNPRAELELIGYLVEAGQFDEANRRIAKLLAKNPEDKEVLTLQAMAQFRQGRYAEAKRTLDRVLSLYPGYARALVVRAQVHLANGDRTLAVADLEAARQAEVSPVVTRQLVDIYERMGDFANAHAVLRSLLVDRPGDAAALRALVELCARHRKWEEMESAITEARKYYPRDLYYIIQAVEMWRQTGRVAQAVAVLRKVKKVLTQSAEIDVLLAQSLLELGQVDEALKLAGALREHHDLGPSAMAICGRAYLLKNDPARADKEFLEAVKKAKAGKRLSFVVEQLRMAYHPKLEPVTSRLKAWVKYRPEDWQLPKLLADLLVLQADYKGAREQLRRALKLVKEKADRFRVLRQLGVVCYQLKDFARAKEYYAQALEMTPDDKVTLNNLAWMLAFDLGKAQEALPYAKRAVELAPYSAHTLDTYGVVLMRLGKLDEAVEVLNRSVDIKSMPANRLHLGEVYEKIGRKSDAIRQYRQGWRQVKNDSADPSYQPLRDALKRLGESVS